MSSIPLPLPTPVPLPSAGGRRRSATEEPAWVRRTLIGAAIGTVAGVFTGLVGLVLMPLVGAAIGEFLARRDTLRAGRVGLATWLGLLAATVAKLAIVFTMVGIFVAALLL